MIATRRSLRHSALLLQKRSNGTLFGCGIAAVMLLTSCSSADGESLPNSAALARLDGASSEDAKSIASRLTGISTSESDFGGTGAITPPEGMVADSRPPSSSDPAVGHSPATGYPPPLTPAPAASYPKEQLITSRLADHIGAAPGYLTQIGFTGFDTSVMRITDTSFGGGRLFRHDYSIRQPWNADGSQLLLKNSPTALLDGRTFRPLGSLNLPDDAIWSNRDPDLIYGVEANSFVRLTVSSRNQQTMRTFPNYSRVYIGGGEGNVSDDDRYVVLIGKAPSAVDILVYDIPDDRVVSTRRFEGYTGPWGDIDSAVISRSGKYVVLGVSKPERGYDLYDSKSMAFLRRLVDNQRSHADIGYTTEGHEVLVTQASRDTAMSSIRLADGVQRQEVAGELMAWNQHTSCRNNLRPGWCYVGTSYQDANTSAYMYRQIFAIKLDGTGKVQRFAPNPFADKPADEEYMRESHAVPSRDGRLVLFASDWRDGSSSAVIHTYVAGTQIPLR